LHIDFGRRNGFAAGAASDGYANRQQIEVAVGVSSGRCHKSDLVTTTPVVVAAHRPCYPVTWLHEVRNDLTAAYKDIFICMMRIVKATVLVQDRATPVGKEAGRRF
jgi:hypothetical protein